MKRTLPIIILLALLGGLIMSWSNVLSFAGREEREFKSLVKKAEEYEKKEIYIDAVAQYEKALAMRPDNYEVAMKIVELYSDEKLANNAKYLRACENANRIKPKEQEPYRLIIDYYRETGAIAKEYETIKKAIEKAGLTDYQERLLEIKSSNAEVYLKYEEISTYHRIDGKEYAVAKLDGELMLITKDAVVLSGDYEKIGLLGGNVIPVKQGGEWFYVTREGYKKRVPEKKAEYLGTFANGYAPACVDGVYGYYSTTMKASHFEYDYAGPFEGNVATVCKDGKWKLINSSFDDVGEKKHEGILLDEFGYGTTYGVYFAKEDGKLYVYSKTGKRLSDGFEDAKLFASNEPAAVKVNGKWTFVSQKGKLLESPQYEDAESFNLGFAPVKIDGKWGVIDEEYNLLVEPLYDSMTPFGSDGTSIVTRDGITMMLKMLVVNYGG